MKRRDVLCALPLTAAGMLGLPKLTLCSDKDSQPLSLQYLGKVKKMLKRIWITESDNLLEASYQIARTYKNGGTCYSTWDVGHSRDEDMFEGRHGDTDIFTMSYPADKAKKGDLYLAGIIGVIEDPRKKEVFVIGGTAPWCGETATPELLSEKHRNYRIKPYSDLWIETYCPTYGAIIWLPEAPYPMGAVSTVLGMTTFWMMIADAVRILAGDGIYVEVKGDGPELGKKAPYVSLTSPLAQDYLKEVFRQLDCIEDELGAVNKTADIAVQTILSGGKIYVYSKYWAALSIEANTRMGGLTMFRPLNSDRHKDYKGTNKDLVIMGIYQPEDEVDLEYLKKFKESGAVTVSIGPATRDWKFPRGETVPSQTDIHLGYMCDTYGLFAVPGVKKKVCPTSGVLVNQLFYAVCMRMAELIIERTGNIPYIYPNGAILQKPNYIEFNEIHSKGQNRGY